jgi:hypothetical protein
MAKMGMFETGAVVVAFVDSKTAVSFCSRFKSLTLLVSNKARARATSREIFSGNDGNVVRLGMR